MPDSLQVQAHLNPLIFTMLDAGFAQNFESSSFVQRDKCLFAYEPNIADLHMEWNIDYTPALEMDLKSEHYETSRM